MRSAGTVLCHLWPVRLYYNFPPSFINDTIFGKELLNIHGVFRFYPHFLPEKFLILRRTERDMTTHVYRSSRGDILVKLAFSRQIFEKSSNAKFHEKSAKWEPNCSLQTGRKTNGHSGRHDEANRRFSQFCERA